MVDVNEIARVVINGYLVDGVNPTDGLAKEASIRGLNDNWIKRAAEVINISLHKTIAEKEGTSAVEFDLADASRVVDIVKSSTPVEKTASAVKLDHGLRRELAERIRMSRDIPIEKTASAQKPEIPKQQARPIITSELLKKANNTMMSIYGMRAAVESDLEKAASELAREILREGINDLSKSFYFLKAAAQNTYPQEDFEIISAVMEGMRSSASFEKMASIDAYTESTIEESSKVKGILDAIVKLSNAYFCAEDLVEEMELSGINKVPSTELEKQTLHYKVATIEKAAAGFGSILKTIGSGIGRKAVGAASWVGRKFVERPFDTSMKAMGVSGAMTGIAEKFKNDMKKMKNPTRYLAGQGGGNV